MKKGFLVVDLKNMQRNFSKTISKKQSCFIHSENSTMGEEFSCSLCSAVKKHNRSKIFCNRFLLNENLNISELNHSTNENLNISEFNHAFLHKYRFLKENVIPKIFLRNWRHN